MPSFELYIAGDIVFGPGNTISLVGGYDGSNDTDLEIVDDDGVFEGDLFRNEDGNDANQFGQATLADGSTIGSLTPGSETTVYSEQQFTLTAPDGSTITLYQVEIDSNPASTAGAGIFAGYLPSEPLDPNTTYTWTISNTVPSNDSDYTAIEGAICFSRGTSIETADGPSLIETLSNGVHVQTLDGLAVIRWIGSRHYGPKDLAANPKLLPVRIASGALGNGLPHRDLLVSRQHRMLVSSKIVERVCGTKEALIAAINLTELPGIFVDESVREIEYFHLLFDQHEVVFAEGALSESLFTGPIALQTLSQAARTEIFTIFPELIATNRKSEPARMMPDSAVQKRIIARHTKNQRALLDT